MTKEIMSSIFKPKNCNYYCFGFIACTPLIYHFRLKAFSIDKKIKKPINILKVVFENNLSCMI